MYTWQEGPIVDDITPQVQIHITLSQNLVDILSAHHGHVCAISTETQPHFTCPKFFLDNLF